MILKAIDTQYKNHLFRSRLEARWAVYFDAENISWQYEPEGFILDNGMMYLPDFYLPEFDCFAEVKPKQFTEIEFIKASSLSFPCVLLDTPAPSVTTGYFATGIFENSTYSDYLHGDDYGRVLLQESKGKGRLWFLLGEKTSDYLQDEMPEIKAKSARFEFGCQP